MRLLGSRRASPAAGGTYRFGFAMTTSLGNAVVVDNLRKYVARDASVHAEWAPISHWIDPDPYRRLPGPLHTQAVLNAETAAIRRRWTQMDAAVVHSFQMFAYLATFKRFGRRSPLLTISQDYAPIADRDFLRSVGQSPADGPLHDLRVSVQRAYVRRADLVLARTEWARDGFLTECRVPPEKLHLVHHGVDLEVWGDARRNERSGPVRILFVGGDFQRKGGGLLLDVFTKRFAGAAELHLLTGTPPLQPPPGVVVHDRKAPNSRQLRALYESCDMFVLPSHGDYSPLALMEAMACRLPVVSTPVGGIPEICESGRTGYLVPVGDGSALAAALDRLVSDTDLRRRMGAAGRKRVESRFSAQGNTELMLDVLKSAVDQRRRTEKDGGTR